MDLNKQMALADLKKKSAFSYSSLMIKQSELFNALNQLATKTEEQLSKKDLYYLINRAIGYMRAYNIHQYFRSEYRNALMGEIDNGNINDANGKD